MTLTDWLAREGIPRKQFAETVSISAPYLTHLCDGRYWPGRDVAERIRAATNGEVTPNDFLPPAGSDAVTPGEPAADSAGRAGP